jgi:hypothetical protein
MYALSARVTVLISRSGWITRNLPGRARLNAASESSTRPFGELPYLMAPQQSLFTAGRGF